jgi:hypothetical protein
MADINAHKAILDAIREEWDKAERDIKLGEQVANNIVIPSIKELRYAGRRIAEIISLIQNNSSDEEITALFNDAKFDCHRARHDAVDAASSKIAIDLEIIAKKLGYDVVLHVVPDFANFHVRLNNIREKITKSRKNRDDRDSIYESIESDDFEDLVKSFRHIQQSEPIMIRIARQRRRERVAMIGLGVVGVFLGLWAIFIK